MAAWRLHYTTLEDRQEVHLSTELVAGEADISRLFVLLLSATDVSLHLRLLDACRML